MMLVIKIVGLDVSKESKIKKRLEQEEKRKAAAPPPLETKRTVTLEERAAIVRDRLANRPVLVIRSPSGRWNRRFLYTMALMIVALIAALIFLTRY